jgi:hypothetical protein
MAAFKLTNRYGEPVNGKGDDRRRVALLFNSAAVRRENEYTTVTASFVTVDARGRIRNGVDTEISDLVVNAQANPGDGSYYGFTVRYQNVYSVDLWRAKQMVRTLQLVEKRLEAIRNVRGAARTFGEFVGRVLEVFEPCAPAVIETVRNGSFYDDGEHRFHEGAAGIAFVDNLLAPPKPEPVEG